MVGPDMRAFGAPLRRRSAAGARRGAGPGAVGARTIEGALCAACAARRRRLRVRLHACRYEDFVVPAAEEPDLTAVFHAGFAADQPQEVESGAGQPAGSLRGGSARAERAGGGARKRRRAAAASGGGGPADAMPSLQRAWQPCMEKLAGLTCPLLLTAFSFAGAPLHKPSTMSTSWDQSLSSAV